MDEHSDSRNLSLASHSKNNDVKSPLPLLEEKASFIRQQDQCEKPHSREPYHEQDSFMQARLGQDSFIRHEQDSYAGRLGQDRQDETKKQYYLDEQYRQSPRIRYSTDQVDRQALIQSYELKRNQLREQSQQQYQAYQSQTQDEWVAVTPRLIEKLKDQLKKLQSDSLHQQGRINELEMMNRQMQERETKVKALLNRSIQSFESKIVQLEKRLVEQKKKYQQALKSQTKHYQHKIASLDVLLYKEKLKSESLEQALDKQTLSEAQLKEKCLEMTIQHVKTIKTAEKQYQAVQKANAHFKALNDQLLGEKQLTSHEFSTILSNFKNISC